MNSIKKEKTTKTKKTNNKLHRFAKQIAPNASKETIPQFPGRYSRLAKSLGGELLSGPAGAYCLIKKFYPFGYRFGSVTIDPPSEQAVPLSAVTVHESNISLKPEQLLYVDTETTGLGGAGTVPFLIGCGSIVVGGFEIRQYMLPDYSDEAEMLEGVAAEITTRNCSVTYNGGPFDLPIIRDRMIINRVARELGFEENLDLLPATRRLYKRRLQSCKLTNIERELFGFYRQDDTPGYLIPSIYFDWLANENLADLPGVLEHNRWDILAMYVLLENLVRVARSEGEVLDQTDDVFSLQRLYQKRKSIAQVMNLCQRLNAEETGIKPDIRLFQAMALKRSGAWAEAFDIWQSLVDSGGRVAYEANIELAKYYEHRLKDVDLAVQSTIKAKHYAPDSPTHRSAIEKRLGRLNRLISLA